MKNEAVLVLSTRSGKSFLVSVIALYDATRDTWKRYVAKNEDVYICVVATRELQAKMIIQGVSIIQVQNKLGHKSPAITSRYIGIDQEEINNVEKKVCIWVSF